MRFFTSLYLSLGNLPWLKAQKNNSGKAWGYFFLFTLLTSLVILVPVLMMMPGIMRDAKQGILTQLPAFNATVKNGELTVAELNQPFVVRSSEGDMGFVFVVDAVTTTTPHIAEYVQSGDSGLLFTKNGYEFYNGANGALYTRPWRDIGDFTLSKESVIQWTNTHITNALLPIAFLIGLVALYIAQVVSKLLGLVVVSFIVWIVVRVRKNTWRFGELFTIGLFAQTLPAIIALALPWLGFGESSVFFLAMLAFMLALVFTKEPSESIQSESQSSL